MPQTIPKRYIINDPSCRGAEREDALHYFLKFPLYNQLKNKLHENILQHAPFNMKTLPYGDNLAPDSVNRDIADIVQEYIRKSKRFG